MNQRTEESLLTAVASGCLAAAVASYVTFPLDFKKTRMQLNNKGLMARFKVPDNKARSYEQLMTGSSALVLGNVVKSFARLTLYNWATNFMATDTHGDHKKTSPPRVVIAGAISGFIETMWIVPFERIKITMIQNSLLAHEQTLVPVDVTGQHGHKHASTVFQKQYVLPHAYYTADVVQQLKTGKPARFTPQLSKVDQLKVAFNKHPALSLSGTVKQMYALHGVRAFTVGTMVTLTRQVATSLAWFNTYNATRHLLDPHLLKQEDKNWFTFQLLALQLLALHVVSALAVVSTTQPLDVVKSAMQLKNGRAVYKDSLLAAYSIVSRRGFAALYAGLLPRFLKIAVHGGITAVVYFQVEKGINVMDEATIFGV